MDVHKDTDCAVAVDEAGRRLGKAMTFRTTDAGCLQLWRWAQRSFGSDVVSAVEDCPRLTTRLERTLLAADARVLRVPPKLMAGAPESARRLRWHLHELDPTIEPVKRRLARIAFNLLHPTDSAACCLPAAGGLT